jgi:hypothetical protein
MRVSELIALLSKMDTNKDVVFVKDGYAIPMGKPYEVSMDATDGNWIYGEKPENIDTIEVVAISDC